MPEHRPQKRNLLVIGQSHVAAFRAAAKAHREAFPDEPRTRVIHTLEEAHAPEFENGIEGDRSAFGPKLRAAIEDQIARHDPVVVSVVGGNVHNVLTLLRHPRPFDFVLPEEESGPPFDPGAELIPEALVRAVLQARLSPDFARLRALREVAGPFLQIESPPPVRDAAYIARQAEQAFRDRAQGEIAAAGEGVRWRMWRLSSRLLREAVEAMGSRYLPAPAEARDGEGFLRLDFAADPTHGNLAYGALLIRAIESA